MADSPTPAPIGELVERVEKIRALMTTQLPGGKGVMIRYHKNANAYDLLEAFDTMHARLLAADELLKRAGEVEASLKPFVDAWNKFACEGHYHLSIAQLAQLACGEISAADFQRAARSLARDIVKKIRAEE